MKALLLTAALSTSAIAMADTLQIPLGQQGDPSIQTPARGATMSTVAKHFGTPTKIAPAVGDPPIATWHYPQFRVYFEYDKVIHSVKSPTSTQP